MERLLRTGVNNFSVIQTLCDAGYQYRVDKFGNPQTTLMHTIYVLDVDGKDKTALFKACSSTVRRHIRKGESFLQLEELTKEELPRFKNILEDTASRKGFTDRNISYYQNMYDCFVPEKRLKFYVVKLDIKKYLTTSQRQLQQEQKRYENLSSLETTDDATLAAQKQKVDSAIKRVDKAEKLEEAYGDLADISAGCFFYWGHEILNLYAGNLSEFMKFEGQYYLYWELIEQTVDQGYKLFNFYGIPNNVSDPDLDVHGVYEAKKNFNGRVEELLGEFDYVISPFKHQLYQFCSTTYFRIQQMMHKSA
jgi:alanine adding enzyme